MNQNDISSSANQEPESKQRIFRACLKLFAERPIESVSVRMICKEANINMSMISYYYDGKEQLIEAVADYYLQVFQAKLLPISNLPDANARLRATGELLGVARSGDLFSIAKIIVNEIKSTASYNSSFRRLAEMFFEFIDTVFQTGIDEGSFRADIDATTMAQIYRSLIFFQMLRGVKTDDIWPEITDFTTYIEQATDIVYRGVKKVN